MQNSLFHTKLVIISALYTLSLCASEDTPPPTYEEAMGIAVRASTDNNPPAYSQNATFATATRDYTASQLFLIAQARYDQSLERDRQREMRRRSQQQPSRPYRPYSPGN